MKYNRRRKRKEGNYITIERGTESGVRKKMRKSRIRRGRSHDRLMLLL